jgi:hypothetical protein
VMLSDDRDIALGGSLNNYGKAAAALQADS